MRFSMKRIKTNQLVLDKFHKVLYLFGAAMIIASLVISLFPPISTSAAGVVWTSDYYVVYADGDVDSGSVIGKDATTSFATYHLSCSDDLTVTPGQDGEGVALVYYLIRLYKDDVFFKECSGGSIPTPTPTEPTPTEPTPTQPTPTEPTPTEPTPTEPTPTESTPTEPTPTEPTPTEPTPTESTPTEPTPTEPTPTEPTPTEPTPTEPTPTEPTPTEPTPTETPSIPVTGNVIIPVTGTNLRSHQISSLLGLLGIGFIGLGLVVSGSKIIKK
jgi:hypothetical protein